VKNCALSEVSMNLEVWAIIFLEVERLSFRIERTGVEKI